MRSRLVFAVPFLAAVLAAGTARADVLAVDDALLVDVAELLEEAGAVSVGTSTALPLALEASRHAAASSPQGKPFGIGVQVGAPTALTIKYMLAPTQGLVVGVGVGFGYRGGFGAGLSIHADYLFHLAQLVKNDTLGLSFYAGPGLWLSLFNGGYGFGYGYYYGNNFALFGIGARLPLGLSLAFAAAPIEVYLELDPALFVFPGVDFGLGASLGFRFYL